MESRGILPLDQKQHGLCKGPDQDRKNTTGPFYGIDDRLLQTGKAQNKERQKPLCNEKPDLVGSHQDRMARIGQVINTANRL